MSREAGSRTTLRAVVVDDEPPARALLREYLGAHADIEVVAECGDGFEAVKRIGELHPDLVFLDIQMPRLTGFEVLELLDPGPAVVFVTAYDEHALHAFEVNAVDYLLKPYGRERLAEALARARERLRAAAAGGGLPAVPATRLAAAALPPGRFTDRILIRDGAQVHVVPVERVDFIEAQDDYVGVHAEGKMHLRTQTLSELAESLDPQRFVRVHRSYVVNLDRVARLETYTKDSRVVVLHGGREIPVSRSGYARLREMM
jgi:two-component system LytT family response regulator